MKEESKKNDSKKIKKSSEDDLVFKFKDFVWRPMRTRRNVSRTVFKALKALGLDDKVT